MAQLPHQPLSATRCSVVYLDQSIKDFDVDIPVFDISISIIVCNANSIFYRASNLGTHIRTVTRAHGETIQGVLGQTAR